MNKVYHIAVLFFVLFAFTTEALGQATTATATATATIVKPISITKIGDMSFGNIATSSVSGTVILPASGGSPNRSATGGVTLPVASGTVSAAEFTVSGQDNYTYSISLPTSGYQISEAGSSETLTINNFTCNQSPIGTLSNSGNQTLNVGATLTIGANQVSGVYEDVDGGFTVIVNYN